MSDNCFHYYVKIIYTNEKSFIFVALAHLKISINSFIL